MAKFLTTTSISYVLEEIIKKSKKNLILVSPYLKLNARIKEMLLSKMDSGVTVRVVYGKKEMADSELSWFAEYPDIALHYSHNLHAKCYMTDSYAIVCSLNLYEYSQVNNHEMGVLLSRNDDEQAFADCFTNVSSIVKSSERIEHSPNLTPEAAAYDLLTTANLAKKIGMSTSDLEGAFLDMGYLELKGTNKYLTNKSKSLGAKFRKGKYSYYFLWPHDLSLEIGSDAPKDSPFISMLRRLL
ncbi:MAG: phospholipase D family protein [Thalassolituus sp.]|jgi:hypothetical protein|nr:MAG: DNA repair protein [Oceanobacter sp.]